MSKKNQITIFVIIALIIVVSIIAIFALYNQNNEKNSLLRNDPRGYMQKCAKDALTDIEKNIIPLGGFANSSLYFNYNNLKITYLCYTSGNNQLCTNVHPALKSDIENGIYKTISPIIARCFNDVKNQYKSYNYKEGTGSLSIEIDPKSIIVKNRKTITYTKSGIIYNFDNFDTNIQSSLFDMTRLATEISNEEVTCVCGTQSCNADISALNRYNREFEISKPVYTGSGVEVYTIKEILSGKEFNIAIRNCVRTP